MAKRDSVNTRTFNVSDAEMLSSTKIIKKSFEADFQQFTSFHPKFTDSFKDNWETTIVTAEAEGDDNTYINKLEQLTNSVKDIASECKKHYQKAKYFIEEAFPDNPTKWKELGYDDYNKIKSSIPKLIQFMQLLSNVFVTNAAELIKAGYSQEKIDVVSTLKTKLETAYNNQQVFKKQRSSYTASRIEKMNDVWQYLRTVCHAAKTIFDEDPIKMSIYTLPTSNSSSSDNDDSESTGDAESSDVHN